MTHHLDALGPIEILSQSSDVIHSHNQNAEKERGMNGEHSFHLGQPLPRGLDKKKRYKPNE